MANLGLNPNNVDASSKIFTQGLWIHNPYADPRVYYTKILKQNWMDPDILVFLFFQKYPILEAQKLIIKLPVGLRNTTKELGLLQKKNFAGSSVLQLKKSRN